MTSQHRDYVHQLQDGPGHTCALQQALSHTDAKKEFPNWEVRGSARPLLAEERLRALSSLALRKRVLRSRNCYRNKTPLSKTVTAKCRTVVIGCSDPDLPLLDRNSPTTTRISFMILLQVYAMKQGTWA